MKIITAFLLFSLLAFTETDAQQYTPFPDSNAEWRVMYLGTCENAGIPDTVIIKYWLDGDTLLNGMQWHKLTADVAGYASGLMEGKALIREENKKIYINHQDVFTDTLLYDFNISIGDTAKVGYGERQVNNVDSVLTGNTYSRRLHFNGPAFNQVDWIEGIGSTSGLVSDKIPVPTCGNHTWELICFKKDGVVKYLSPNFDSCDAKKPKSYTSIKTPTQYSTLKIFPNPTLSKQFHIDNVDAYEGLSAKVTDYTGKIILSQNLNHVSNIVTLPNEASLYVLIIVNKQGQVVLSQKIVNQ